MDQKHTLRSRKPHICCDNSAGQVRVIAILDTRTIIENMCLPFICLILLLLVISRCYARILYIGDTLPQYNTLYEFTFFIQTFALL